MKKIIISMLIAPLFLSCNKNGDPPPFRDIVIFVKNAAGENLLDPALEGNILDYDITIEYDGETIALGSLMGREDGEGFLRFMFREIPDRPDKNILLFGVFFYDDRSLKSFVINWGDGTSDEVEFEWYSRGMRDYVCNVWLNGELQSDKSLELTIVK